MLKVFKKILLVIQKINPEIHLPYFRIFSRCRKHLSHTCLQEGRPAARFYFYGYILPILYPRHCPVCQTLLPYGKYICDPCAASLPYVTEPICLRCGKPISSAEQEYCYDCRHFPKSFRSGLALFVYNETTRPVMAAFKYKNRRMLSQFFAREIVRRHKDDLLQKKPQLCIPVPIHKNKLRQRNYNQAALLAMDLSVLLHIPYCGTLLLRTVDTPPQKNLRPQARFHNLQNAFTINPACPHLLKGISTVLLVDDIYTTGATMEICTRILQAAGIENVIVYSVCIGIARD